MEYCGSDGSLLNKMYNNIFAKVAPKQVPFILVS